MKRRHIMFAVGWPADIGTAVADKVARVAAAMDAEVELFQCVFDRVLAHPQRFSTQRSIRHLVESRHRRLEPLAARLRARGVRVRSSVRWDHPVHEGIVRQALRHEPALLIVQSSRRRGRLASLLGRTDFRLIERCPCPVLFIRSREPYARTPVVLAAVDPRVTHGKPLELDDEILRSAGVLCAALGGELAVFHARPSWQDAMRADPDLKRVPEVVRNDVYGAYCDRIDSQVADVAARHGVPRERVHVLEGTAAQCLPIAADEASADIVAVGAVSRSILRRAITGHTAERAFDSLECDVLVVKPPGFRTPISRQSQHHVDGVTRYPSWTVYSVPAVGAFDLRPAC